MNHSPIKNDSAILYKILLPALMILELGLIIATLNINFNISFIICVLTLPPTSYFLYKQFDPEISIPPQLALVFYGFALDLALMPLRSRMVDMRIGPLLGFALCLAVTFLLIKNNRENIKPHLTACYLLIGISLLQLPIRVYDFIGSLGSLPDHLMHLLGIATGLFLYQREKPHQKINLVISLSLVVFFYFYGYQLWDTMVTKLWQY